MAIDPIEFLIEFAWANGADQSVVNNAKDALRHLKEINSFHTVAWARINSRGDLYDPRLIFNPNIDESTILPLYVNEKEYKEKYGKLSE